MLEYCPAAQFSKGGDCALFSMSQYMLAFIVPSVKCSPPVLAAIMRPQIMTLLPPCLIVGKTHLFLCSSPGCWHTRLTPPKPSKFILASSDHRSWLQWSMSLVCLSSANCLQAFLCIIFRRGFLLGRQPCRPICCRLIPHPFNLHSNAGSTHTLFYTDHLWIRAESSLPWGAMLNFQWPAWETVRVTPASHSHLRPCNTNESHDMADWAQFGHFHLGMYLLLLPAVQTLMAVCWVFEQTVNLHCYTSCTLTLHCSKVSFLQCWKRYLIWYEKYIQWKDMIEYLQEREGCTCFCEMLQVERRLSSCPSYRLFVTLQPKNSICHRQTTLTHQVFVWKKITTKVSPPDWDFSEVSPSNSPARESASSLLMVIL